MQKEYSVWDKKSLKTVVGKSANFDELAKDCVAFANFKGGNLHIGIEDEADLPDAEQTISVDVAEKVVRRVNELTINVGLYQNIVTAENGGQYIDLQVLPSKSSVASTTSGKYFIRDNDKSRTLLPDELLRLVGDKPSYCWETATSLELKLEDADVDKINRFVGEIKRSNRVSPFVKAKTTKELLEHYLMIDEQGTLTNLGVLWIGKKHSRARLLYSPSVQFIKYDESGNKVQKKVWDDYERNPQELLESIWTEVPDWKESNEVSEGLWRIDIPAYDEKVVREVLANALVHRPYTTRGDIYINLHPDRMEVVNPGQLPYGVTASSILHKSVQRNEHLSKVFHDLHLMEKEGSGYDLIYEVLLSWGKELPVVYEGDDFVKVTINRRIIDKEAYHVYQYIDDHYKLPQKALIAFGIIFQKKKVKSLDLSKILQLSDNDRLRDYIGALLNEKIILSEGATKSTAYHINPTIINNSKANIPTSLKTIEPYRLKALIEEDLRYHPSSLMADIANRLPDIEFGELQKMVRKLAKEGAILHDGGKKYRKYFLPKS